MRWLQTVALIAVMMVVNGCPQRSETLNLFGVK